MDLNFLFRKTEASLNIKIELWSLYISPGFKMHHFLGGWSKLLPLPPPPKKELGDGNLKDGEGTAWVKNWFKEQREYALQAQKIKGAVVAEQSSELIS
jgi:hypothetical protein